MTTDEKDLMFGRLMREQKETAKHIGALENRLSVLADKFHRVYLNLNGVWSVKPKPAVEIDDALQVVNNIPDQKTVVDTLEELRSARRRADEIKMQLEKAN
jgi:hypothetical protein